MNAEFEVRRECPCGHTTPGIAFGTITPRMHDFTARTNFGVIAPECSKCGLTGSEPIQLKPTPETLAKVDAWRDRQRARRKKATT